MEDDSISPETSIGISLIALIIGILIFVIVWIIGSVAFNLFDSARGLGDDKLQSLFRGLIVPGVGGYLGMASVNSWFEKASIRFVFFGFAAIIFALVAAVIGFGALFSDLFIDMDLWNTVLSAMSIITAVVGAYICVKNDI